MGLLRLLRIPGEPPPPPLLPPPTDLSSLWTGVLLVLAAVCVIVASSGGSVTRRAGVRVAYIFAMVVNLVTVSVPGRFDSDIEPGNMSFPWPTVFSPAGFALCVRRPLLCASCAAYNLGSALSLALSRAC